MAVGEIRRPPRARPAFVKTSIKSLLGRVIFESNLHALLLRDVAVIVAFHRIEDTTAASGLTTSVGMFERYCRFFQRHFRVVSLPDLVHRLERGLPLNRELAITFDDGYRDNFENAVPVLEKFSLPATFFVVTQWIGTDVVPWWDRQQGVRHPWMTWDQVRRLHRKGFDVGAHTRTHVDLGGVSDDEARVEIREARFELERQLAAPVELFAYPYGGPSNLAETSRAFVKASGFRCCCSCFGGGNPTGTDPFHLRRVPISPWYASPHEFGLEVALGMSRAA
jgi:peptidoglycan/xylan/chitin deacetylase (PgdA/CDA1 family)